MKKSFRVPSLCLTAFFAFALGTGQAAAQTSSQTPTHQGPGGTVTMGKHGETAGHSRTETRINGKLKGEAFNSQMAAKAHCPSQTIVWANVRGRVFHLPKSKYYGKTKHGSYICRDAAEKAGLRAAKS